MTGITGRQQPSRVRATVATDAARAHNRTMILVELALVVVLVWTIVHLVLRLLDRTGAAAPSPPARWRITHVDVDGETRVVLQRHDERRDRVLAQHVVGTVPVDDPDYEARFMALMDAARARRALFEAEEDR